MNKSQTPSVDLASVSGDVPFPQATLKFLDGLTVTLSPNLSLSHSVMGNHYILEGRDEEGQVAAVKITFSSRRRASGQGFERYIEFEPITGQPLSSIGENYFFQFTGKSPSFIPRDNHYKLNQVTPGGGYMIEVSPFYLNCLRLFYEQPPKRSSD